MVDRDKVLKNDIFEMMVFIVFFFNDLMCMG